MIAERHADVAVIGAGAAGLAAAAVCARQGFHAAVIDREPAPGGILRQCIHNGFGLEYFHEELTGPEYAGRVAADCREAGAEFLLDATVSAVARAGDGFTLTVLSGKDGAVLLHARAVMLAMGCRERNRGNIATPGSRPAGVFTAGTAQKLLNMEGILPGSSAVIVGSGDIGLIMARRLTWSGVEVKAVVEIMPVPSGLTRNVVQCLDDFAIPLYLEHAVTGIEGHERVSGVEVAPLSGGVPRLEERFHIDCDTVLYSVGLVPINDLSRSVGVAINPATGGALVDDWMMTSVPGVFAGGNVLHVHDLVDFVSLEAGRAGEGIVRYLQGLPERKLSEAGVKANLRYVIPNRFEAGRPTDFFFRSLIAADRAQLVGEQQGKEVFRKALRFVRPAEMLKVAVTPESEAELTFSLLPEEEKS